MGLLGYVIPSVFAECPRCNKNIFGKGLARLRHWIRFGNYFNLIFGKQFNCHYCGTALIISFKKGKYIAKITA